MWGTYNASAILGGFTRFGDEVNSEIDTSISVFLGKSLSPCLGCQINFSNGSSLRLYNSKSSISASKSFLPISL